MFFKYFFNEPDRFLNVVSSELIRVLKYWEVLKLCAKMHEQIARNTLLKKHFNLNTLKLFVQKLVRKVVLNFKLVSLELSEKKIRQRALWPCLVWSIHHGFRLFGQKDFFSSTNKVWSYQKISQGVSEEKYQMYFLLGGCTLRGQSLNGNVRRLGAWSPFSSHQKYYCWDIASYYIIY